MPSTWARGIFLIVALFFFSSNLRISVRSVKEVSKSDKLSQVDFKIPTLAKDQQLDANQQRTENEDVKKEENNGQVPVPAESNPIEDEPEKPSKQDEQKEGPPFIENLGQFASLTPEEWALRSRIHRLDLIKEPFDPTIPRISTVQPDSPYSYAMICWHSNPEQLPRPGYKPYMANMLVARKLLLESGSKADFNAIFKIAYNCNATRLPKEDEQLLEKLGIKVSYLPKTPDGQNFFVDQFNKFELWNMTQYKRILYLDGDVMPVNNLDYLFELSDGPSPALKPNVVLAGNTEPANGGFFMFQPNATAYRELRQIILNLGPEAGRGKLFTNRMGLFGHTIIPPDKWETNNKGLWGTNFTFHGAWTDQGLLYSFLKYNAKQMTQIFGNRIVHFGPSPTNETTIVEEVTKLSGSPLYNYSRTAYPWWPVSCGKMSGARKRCPPPYADHSHYTGGKKPWKYAKPLDLWDHEIAPADVYLWWQTLDKLQKEGIGIDIKPGKKAYELR